MEMLQLMVMQQALLRYYGNATNSLLHNRNIDFTSFADFLCISLCVFEMYISFSSVISAGDDSLWASKCVVQQ
jgi:hypothetical protein